MANEQHRIIFSAVPGTEDLNIKANTGSTSGLIRANMTNAQIEAVIEALPEYVSCSVTGTLTISGGNYSGVLTVSFDGADANTDVPQLVVTTNHRLKVQAIGATGTSSITAAATPLGAGGTLSYAAGDTSASSQTKTRALVGYNDAGVVAAGSFAEVSGTGEVHAIGGSPTGNGTAYGTVARTVGMTATALETAIRGKGGEWAGVTVTGSSTGAVSGNGFNVSGAGDASYNGFYAENGTFENKPSYTNPGGRWLFSYGIGSQWGFSNAVGNGGSAYAYYINSSAATPPLSGYIANPSGTAPAPTLSAVTGAGTPPSANYSVTFPGSAGNVGDIAAILGNGWTGSVSQQGQGATTNGSLIVDFGGALRNVAIGSWTTNVSGWSVEALRQGGMTHPFVAVQIVTEGGAFSNSLVPNTISAPGNSPVANPDSRPAATTTGWTAQMHVVNEPVLSTGMTVTIKHGPNADKTGGATLCTFAAQTTRGAQRIVSPLPTSSLNLYVWAEWTVSGTGPQFQPLFLVSPRQLQ